MAEKLRSFDFDKPSEITSSDKRLYPWDQWFDGDIWKLTTGEDFGTHPLMMERIIRTRAVNRQAKVRLRHQPLHPGTNDPFGVIIIQRTDMTGPAEQRKAEAAERRRAKKVAATKEAEALLASKGITPINGAKVPRRSKVAAKAASKVPSKRPAKVA
jgi:hypothetical protein